MAAIVSKQSGSGAFALGARHASGATSFALRSTVAERVQVCLFDEAGGERRVDLDEAAPGTWQARVDGVAPGQRYGFRVHGPYAPHQGHRCNPHKLLLDPYARAIEGALHWHPALHGFAGTDPNGPASPSDSAPYVPRCLVIDERFDWGEDHAPNTPWADTLIYELHVKGFTMRHPEIPPALRGTYAALAHPAAIDHLQRLGVTAVELMPVHQSLSELAVVGRGLTNYWGYNPIGLFAPHAAYRADKRAGSQVREFQQMVKALHAAGIEVILDVVYGHTAEQGGDGPTLAWRGIDNAAFYRLDPNDCSQYIDYTGCGNTLATHRPAAAQLVLDSLRYWIEDMHVDGFRFDLATTLGRGEHAFDPNVGLLDTLRRDPAFARVKLIAEPWDLGEGGYQLGNFPHPFSEWNGRYRDAVRDYWRGQRGMRGELVHAMLGSADVYRRAGRAPQASINFITSHDGFTLRDLVSYAHKRNSANGEHDADGTSDNRAWNCGVEGDTHDAHVRTLRARQQRNFLTTLMLSHGVPMLLAGDELGRTQRGNNNAYCHDSELSWLDWSAPDTELLAFVRTLVALRRAHRALRRRTWIEERAGARTQLAAIACFRPDGHELRDADWEDASAFAIGTFLGCPEDEAQAESRDEAGLYFVLNPTSAPMRFTLPTACGVTHWRPLLDTAEPSAATDTPPVALAAGTDLHIRAHSARVLRELRAPSGH